MQVGMSDNLRNSCLTYKKFRRASYAPTDQTPTKYLNGYFFTGSSYKKASSITINNLLFMADN
jgi:hypothetical protein